MLTIFGRVMHFRAKSFMDRLKGGMTMPLAFYTAAQETFCGCEYIFYCKDNNFFLSSGEGFIREWRRFFTG